MAKAKEFGERIVKLGFQDKKNGTFYNSNTAVGYHRSGSSEKLDSFDEWVEPVCEKVEILALACDVEVEFQYDTEYGGVEVKLKTT